VFGKKSGYNRPMPIAIDRLVRSRRKTVALVVERDGSLTVRAPLRLAEAHIHAFVESHADWISKNRARLLSALPASPKKYLEGDTFLYLGTAFPLAIVPPQRPALVFDGAIFRLSKSALPKAEEAFIRWYKQQAIALFGERVFFFVGRNGFHHEKIRISSARTRWGSCSSRNTLSFTYRLLKAPLEVVDYVVLHELVHTQIKNHSKAFWKRLGELMPDYKRHQAWLKKNGKFLM
jgi:predicted metal-dependent hydrolase